MPRRYKVIFDHGAHADLADIKSYLTQTRNEAFAEDFVTRIVRFCQSFRTIPHRGTRLVIDGITLRKVSWRGTVTIAFQVIDATQSLHILAVLYRGRDVRAALGERLRD